MEQLKITEEEENERKSDEMETKVGRKEKEKEVNHEKGRIRVQWEDMTRKKRYKNACENGDMSCLGTLLVDVMVAMTDANWAVVWVDVMDVPLAAPMDPSTAVHWVDQLADKWDVLSVVVSVASKVAM
jgi:hypothetical protein